MLLVDDVGLFDDALCCSMWPGLGIPGSQIPTAGDFASPMANDISLPADAAVELRMALVSADAGLTVTLYDDGSVLQSAAQAGAYDWSYELYADGVDQGAVPVQVTLGATSATLAASAGGSAGGSVSLAGSPAQLDAAGGGESSGTVSLDTQIPLAGAAGGTSGGAATLGGAPASLAAVGGGTAGGSAALETDIALAASGGGNANGTATLAGSSGDLTVAIVVSDFVSDDITELGAALRQRAIDMAVAQYNRDRPRERIEDLVLLAKGEMPTPAYWLDGFSAVLGMAINLDLTPPQELDNDQWAKIQTPLGESIRCTGAVAGDTVRVRYTTKWTEDQIPADDTEAVALWAAALLAEQMASRRSDNSQPTISADSTDQGLPSREWAARARTWRARYAALMGIQGVTGGQNDKPRVVPASAVVEFEDSDQRGYPRLYHGNRRVVRR